MRGGGVTIWTGNYGDYQRQKAEAQALQERQYKVQQRLIQRIEFQARRLKDMANAYDDPGQARRAKAMMRAHRAAWTRSRSPTRATASSRRASTAARAAGASRSP